MIEQVKALFVERGVKQAVIIDDAFDERPRSGDVEDQRWDRMFDDLTEEDEERLAAAYGAEDYARQAATELRRDQLFIDVVWSSRATVDCFGVLFEDFEREQQVKRDALQPLRALLETGLGIKCEVFGRDESAAIAEADIIFLDLFLGFLEQEDAIKRAIERVRGVVAQRRQAPPSVVLLSASPRLHEVGPRVRDDAELLGCQFRMFRKTELADAEKVAERLYELVLSYPDAQKLNAFLLAWETALDDAKRKFVRSIRSLDLADYANTQALILKAEDEQLGDYVLDLYDLHLHHVLEGDEGLVRAAKALNQVKWDDYPPAQFAPSAEVVEMMDGAVFENATRTRVEAELDDDPKAARLGDVFLAPPPPQPAAGGDAAAEAAGPMPRYAYVVLSQACDLHHGNAEHLLLLRGTVRPYSWKHHDNRLPRTPIMQVGEVRSSVTWDLLAVETWRLDTLPAKIAEGYQRVRRFRIPFALHLQQAFIGRLGRVGTLAAAPARYPAGVRVFLRNRAGLAVLLGEVTADSGDAVCLIGRTKKGEAVEWLLLAERLADEVRRSLKGLAAEDLPVGGTVLVSAVRDDPAFYRRLKCGLEIRRHTKDGHKPLNETAYDVVQTVTRRLFEPNGQIPASYRAIVVEVELE